MSDRDSVGRLIDHSLGAYPGPWRFVAWGALCVFGFVLAMLVFVFLYILLNATIRFDRWPLLLQTLTAATIAIPVGVGLYVWDKMRFRRLLDKLRSGTPVEECVACASSTLMVGHLAMALSQAGLSGQCIRIGWEPLRPLHPLDVPIEPLLVDQRESAFEQVRGRTPSSAVQLRGFWARLGAFFLALMGVWWLGTFVVRAALAGRWVEAGGWCALVLVCAVIPRLGRRGWYVVPRGLIIGTIGSAALYTRDDSVLVVRQTSQPRWTLHVVRNGKGRSTDLSSAELDGVLKAWLSPLPAPPRERLDELLGPPSRDAKARQGES